MNRMQKLAWFLVTSISAAVLMGLIAVVVLYVELGPPRTFAGLGFIAIACICGLGPLFFRKNKVNLLYDQRDKLIHKYTALAGFAASYLVTSLAFMMALFVIGSRTTISVVWLPNIFVAAAITYFLMHCLAMLIQYRRGF